MKVVSIITAAPDWFAVFDYQDGVLIYEPVVLWGLDENGTQVFGFSTAQGGLCPNEGNAAFNHYQLMKPGEIRQNKWGGNSQPITTKPNQGSSNN